MSNWLERGWCGYSWRTSTRGIAAPAPRPLAPPSASPRLRRWRPPGSILQPGLLEVAQHQAAHPAERVWIGRVQRRISPQHAPALAAQDLFQIVHGAVDG